MKDNRTNIEKEGVQPYTMKYFSIPLMEWPELFNPKIEVLFKVYLNVSGNDKQVVNTIESRLEKELCRLGDVKVVGEDDDWMFIIKVVVLEVAQKGDTQTQDYTIGTYQAQRLPKHYFKLADIYKDKTVKATCGGSLCVAICPREDLHKFCKEYVDRFNKSFEAARRQIR